MNPFFSTKRLVTFTCVGAVVIIGFTYFESIPNQTTGTDMSGRFQNAYFAIKKSAFEEHEGIQQYNAFTSHPIYTEFKSAYPDSTEEFETTVSGTPILRVTEYDGRGNHITLEMMKDDNRPPFVYAVHCTTNNTLPHPTGVPFEAAFDFIGYNECLED